ncbi:glycosyltransferase family 90 protein [Mixia osmundae IAM 14324]|uniref:Glycosyl transferase CAP10 domain-containing protein n=1 Tax=Mixia osmundae (strain CBS 9802 / IAM 14324 / JCM 22182 / KY 12970) TaxID=764103 RepID=G7E785_MIXOS|nr:glycosyltransferase family 90 protein [Mixia osmundae IAM 14324]KEI41911.1 glycosyltransferase family 90 protein [Mixia osmundae IAM 14324]GAA98695.1 hypothetical protein E5Q_05383 [Mixia osmundae IAM 14324]
MGLSAGPMAQRAHDFRLLPAAAAIVLIIFTAADTALFASSSRSDAHASVAQQVLQWQQGSQNTTTLASFGPNYDPATRRILTEQERSLKAASLTLDTLRGRVFLDAARVGQADAHPIHQLIETGERKWQTLLDKQSTTLDEAVREYRRRYGRNPPRGFDKWWDYANRNNVVLVDEYDHIHHDVEPFYALPASVIRRRTSSLHESQKSWSRTVMVDPAAQDKSRQFAFDNSNDRLGDALGPLREVAHLMPASFNFTVSYDDSGFASVSNDHLEYLRRLTRAGRYIPDASGDTDGYIPDKNSVDHPFLDICPSGSPMHAAYKLPSFREDEIDPVLPDSDGFIYDAARSADACSAPEVYWHHPANTRGSMLQRIEPMFVWSRTTHRTDLGLAPRTRGPVTEEETVPWSKKPFSTLYWRGSLTGAAFRDSLPVKSWRGSPRYRLLHLFTKPDQGVFHTMLAETISGGTTFVRVSLERVSQALFSFAVIGEPIQCDEHICQELAQTFDFQESAPRSDAFKHKYILDIDGNGWSGRFYTLMTSSSAILKASTFPQWWQERIVPWVHYIPVSTDYRDLIDIMMFFRGWDEGGANDHLAERIGQNGKEWALNHWRAEDMIAFHWRLLLEWCRLWNRSDEDAFEYEPSKELT